MTKRPSKEAANGQCATGNRREFTSCNIIVERGPRPARGLSAAKDGRRRVSHAAAAQAQKRSAGARQPSSMRSCTPSQSLPAGAGAAAVTDSAEGAGAAQAGRPASDAETAGRGPLLRRAAPRPPGLAGSR